MVWDGVERRSDELNGRVAVLEAQTRAADQTIRELREDLKTIRDMCGQIRTDMHAARVVGKFSLGAAITLGGVIGWALNFLKA